MKHSLSVQSAENTPRFGSVACARPKKRARFARCAFACGRRRRAAIKTHPPRAGARAHAPRHGRSGARTVAARGAARVFGRRSFRAPRGRATQKKTGAEAKAAARDKCEPKMPSERSGDAPRPAGEERAGRAKSKCAARPKKKKKNAACVPTSRPRNGESSSKDIARASVCTLMGRAMARRGRSVRNINNVCAGAWPLTRAHRGSAQNTAWIPGSLCRISQYSAWFGREDSQQSGVCRDAPSERVRRTRACEVTCCAAAPGSLHIDLRARTLRLPPKKSQRQAGPPGARDDLEGETPTDPERDSAYAIAGIRRLMAPTEVTLRSRPKRIPYSRRSPIRRSMST